MKPLAPRGQTSYVPVLLLMLAVKPVFSTFTLDDSLMQLATYQQGPSE
jgi:hypothetical protein